MNDTIKKMSTEELEAMDKLLLVKRCLVLEEQLEIRIEREVEFSENVNMLTQTTKLLLDSLSCVYSKFENDIKCDLEMSKHLFDLEIKYKSLMVELACKNKESFWKKILCQY